VKFSTTSNTSSQKDYDPFGMITVGRSWSGGSEYRYSFNGKESDSETYGEGNIYDYGFRIYNPRLGRFLSVDPLTETYPFYTPYQFAGNKPILNIDLDGLEDVYYNYKRFDPTNPELLPVLEVVNQVEVEYSNENINLIGDFTNPELNNVWNALIIEIPSLPFGAANTSYIYYETLTYWYSNYSNPTVSKYEKDEILKQVSDRLLLSKEEAIQFIESEAVKSTLEMENNLAVTWVPTSGITDDLGEGKYDNDGNLISDRARKAIVVSHEAYHWWTLIKKNREGGSVTKGPEDHEDLYGVPGAESFPSEKIKKWLPNSLMTKIMTKVETIIIDTISKPKEDN